jgi:hypothetical protein
VGRCTPNYPYSRYRWNRCDGKYYQVNKTYDQCCNPSYDYKELCYTPEKKPWDSCYKPRHVVC